MTVYVALGVKKPEWYKRYCIKVGGHSEKSVRDKLKKKYPDMGFQIETPDSFVRWFVKFVSKYRIAEMVVNEMVNETKRGGNWFYQFPSHTSTGRRLTKDKISTTDISNAETAIVHQIENRGIGVTGRKFLKRALGRKLSTTRFLVVEK